MGFFDDAPDVGDIGGAVADGAASTAGAAQDLTETVVDAGQQAAGAVQDGADGATDQLGGGPPDTSPPVIVAPPPLTMPAPQVGMRPVDLPPPEYGRSGESPFDSSDLPGAPALPDLTPGEPPVAVDVDVSRTDVEAHVEVGGFRVGGGASMSVVTGDGGNAIEDEVHVDVGEHHDEGGMDTLVGSSGSITGASVFRERDGERTDVGIEGTASTDADGYVTGDNVVFMDRGGVHTEVGMSTTVGNDGDGPEQITTVHADRDGDRVDAGIDVESSTDDDGNRTFDTTAFIDVDDHHADGGVSTGTRTGPGDEGRQVVTTVYGDVDGAHAAADVVSDEAGNPSEVDGTIRTDDGWAGEVDVTNTPSADRQHVFLDADGSVDHDGTGIDGHVGAVDGNPASTGVSTDGDLGPIAGDWEIDLGDAADDLFPDMPDLPDDPTPVGVEGERGGDDAPSGWAGAPKGSDTTEWNDPEPADTTTGNSDQPADGQVGDPDDGPLDGIGDALSDAVESVGDAIGGLFD
jgi:hypothetical protein